jgi:hypothetical protein
MLAADKDRADHSALGGRWVGVSLPEDTVI